MTNKNTQEKVTCPECGSPHIDRVEVDIGVGVQCGPWDCYDCGWTEWEPSPEPPFDVEGRVEERGVR